MMERSSGSFGFGYWTASTSSADDGDAGEAIGGKREMTAAAAAAKPRSRSRCELASSITKSLGSPAIMKTLADSYELQKLITKALVMVGAGDLKECKKKSKVIVDGLANLYIRTLDQLKEALETQEVLAQITSGGYVKGRLLSVLREELKHDNVKSAWKKVALYKPESKRKPMNKPLLRKLDVVRVDVTNISEIDQINQTFYARVFLILRMKNGALDSDLVKDSEAFPFDEHGRPTFRPSAKWYLNQIDFPNAKAIRTLDSKVTKEGNNLQLIKRVEGHFNQRFELYDFPFDQQDLTITVSANCAMEGPVPVKFHVPLLQSLDDEKPAQLGVDTVNFAGADIWNLLPKIATEISTLGASSTRRFPSVHLRVNVQRKSQFITLNAALPCACIAFLSLSTFFVPVEDTADRLENTITILLTAVAFRFTTNSFLPMISYMTLVDKFTLLCTGVIVICFISHSILGMLAYWVGATLEFLEFLNKIFFGVFVAAWFFVQVWFLSMQRSVNRRNLRSREKRLKEMIEEEDADKDDAKLGIADRLPNRRASLERQSVTLWKRTGSLEYDFTLPGENSSAARDE